MNKQLMLSLFTAATLCSSLMASPSTPSKEMSSTSKTSVATKTISSKSSTASNSSTDSTTSASSSSSTTNSTSQKSDAQSTQEGSVGMESQIHEEEETNIVHNTPSTKQNTQSSTSTNQATTDSNSSSNSSSTSASTTQATSSSTLAANTNSSSTSTESLNLDTARISATFGYRIATNLMADPGFNFDLDSFIIGMRQAIDGKQAPMSDEEFMEAISKIQEKALQELGEANLSEANQFMTDNKKNASVVEVMEGTLQYEVVQEGKGEVVGATSQPVIHFTGKYLDGMVFASSMDNESPITLPSNENFSFRKGITGAKEGEKRRLYVHPELGVSSKGFHPPSSLLVFDITVIKANNNESVSTSEEISARMGIETFSEEAISQSSSVTGTSR